jgi:hypothetical protein
MTTYFEYDIIIQNGQYILDNPVPTASGVTLTGDGATPNILGDQLREAFDVSQGSTTLDTMNYIGVTTSSLVPELQGLIGEDQQGNLHLFLPNNGTDGFLEGILSFISTSVKDDPKDGHTQWNIQDGTPNCFLAGTRIATPDGEVLVEALLPGDFVSTQSGGVAPVRWLGKASVARDFSDPLKIMPIRICAGALGEALPLRDLLLSPDHAVLVDDVLIQAGALENGVSIVRETRMPLFFTYYHVELADHALVLAEGVPSETFIDNVDRFAFDNWQEHEASLPDAAPIEEMPYPRAQAQRQVPSATLRRLAERAAQHFTQAQAA